MDGDVRREYLAQHVSSDLQYVLQEAGVALSTQYDLAQHYKTVKVFSSMCETKAELREALRTDSRLDPASNAGVRADVAKVITARDMSKTLADKEKGLQVETKVLGMPRVLQHTERQAMVKAVEAVLGKLQDSEIPSNECPKVEECEQNEPIALGLDEITSRSESSTSSLQTSLDASGHVRVTKVKLKGKVPDDTESLCRALKLEGIAWLCMAAKFRNKAWLHGLEPQHWTKYTEYLLGEEVNGLKFNVEGQTQSVKQPWAVVLGDEQRMRKEVFKQFQAGTHTLAESLQAIVKDPEIKEAHLTAPIALGVGWNREPRPQQPNKWQKTSYKGRPQHKGGKGNKGQKGGKGGKGNSRDFNGLIHQTIESLALPSMHRVVLASAAISMHAEFEAAMGSTQHESTMGRHLHLFGSWMRCEICRWIQTPPHGRYSNVFTAPASASLQGRFQTFLASLVASVLRIGASSHKDEPSSTAGGQETGDVQMSSLPEGRSTKLDSDVRQDGGRVEEGLSSNKCVPPDPPNWGKPIKVEWSGEEREITDGLGLCSPNRWPPECRGVGLSAIASELNQRLHDLLRSFVWEQLGDPREMAFKLATGKLSESPFCEAAVEKLRKDWAALLPVPDSAMVRADGQPLFYLDMMAQTLKLRGDPDYSILVDEEDSFTTGVPVCYEQPIPPVPSVFRPREKQSSLDDSEYMEVSRSYKSAVENKEGREAKFREDESKGMMLPTTMGVLKEKYKDQPILVAAMGAIKKPDGSVRPIHDGTHFVQVNNGIVFTDKLDYPGPPDVAGTVRLAKATKEAVFTISADIKAAHRLTKAREKDGRLLVCKADSDTKVCWGNRVGTFGVSGAPYWWTRPFGLVGRLVSRLLLRRWSYQLVYVDDLHAVEAGEQKFETLWMALAAYEVLGTPFGYKKFSGGLETQFVGYRLDYPGVSVGISGARGEWLVNLLEDLRRDKYIVHVHRFAEFLGRLGFTCRVLLWLKPHLAPVYAWASAVNKGTVSTVPLRIEQEVFRTETKCEKNRVVLGGNHFPDGRWFSLELSPLEAPYLFKSGGESEWASAPAELLAVLVALCACGHLAPINRRASIKLRIQGGTDNESVDHLAKKNSTTRWPLTLINIQLSHLMMRAGLRVKLAWRPRDENTLADDFTNCRFDGVDASKRVRMCLGDLDFSLLDLLWESRSEYLDRESWLAHGDGKEKTEKSAWG